MDSVAQNNTLQEFWQERPDGGSVMSHSCPVPLYMLYMGIAGIQPLEPGFTRCMIRPQPGDLERVELVAPTARGEIRFLTEGKKGERRMAVTMPEGCTGELTVDKRERLHLKTWREEQGLRRYILPPGGKTEVNLLFT
jgi:hypothetical protein